jgi:hypothetical protein
MLRSPAAGVAAVLVPVLVSSMGIGWFFTGWAIFDLIVVGGAVIGKCLQITSLEAFSNGSATVLNIFGPRWRKERNEKARLRTAVQKDPK